jgi:ABC-type phosphate transport system substrate-binding protein
MTRLALMMAVGLVLGARTGSSARPGSENRPAARRIAVVVNKSNPASTQTLALLELSRIFLRERTKWPNGDAITVIDRSADHAIAEQFSRTLLGKSPRQLSEYWLNLKLTRGLDPPKVCQSTPLLKRYLERLSGAIGYMYEEEVDDTIKVLRVLEAPR